MRRALLPLLAFLLLHPPSSAAQCGYPTVFREQFRSTALDISIDGSDLWLATNYGVALYDRSQDPPAFIASLPLPGATTRVRATSGIAYVVSGTAIYTVKRAGRSLILLGSIDLKVIINDLLLHQSALYVATSTGVQPVELLVPESPVVTRPPLSTSTGFALSLARIGSTLYAADGDRSVEAYSIQIPTMPQRLGSIPTIPVALYLSVATSRLFVSDALETEIFSGSGFGLISLGRTQISITSLYPLSPDVALAAAGDRVLRAIDITSPNLAILFETSVAPLGGSISSIQELNGVPGRLYVAAGDSGLLTYDTSGFTAPFAIRTTLVPSASSIFSLGTSTIVAGTDGGLRQYSLSPGGTVTLLREWDLARRSTIRDVNGPALLTTSASSFTIWNLGTTPPAAQTSGTFPSSIRAAVLASDAVYAVLSDRTLWRAETQSGAISRVSLTGAPSFIVRSGRSLALADLLPDGTTQVRYFADGNPAAPAISAKLQGTANSGIALSASGRVAAATFRGIEILDFATPSPTVLTVPYDSARVRALSFSGGDLLILSADLVETIDLSRLERTRSFALPGDSLSIHHDGGSGAPAVIAGSSGVTTFNLSSQARVPSLFPTFPSNAFYRKIAGSDSVLALFDGKRVTITPLRNGLPDSGSRVAGPSAIDVAVIGSTVFALTSGGKVIATDVKGSSLGEIQLTEGSGVFFRGIAVMGPALWVTVAGCPGGQCQNRTLVLDPRGGGLAQTATLNAGFVDGVTTGSRGFVLADFPSGKIEIRVMDLSDPFHPSVLNARLFEETSAQVPSLISIAHSSTRRTIYALGERVHAFDESSLVKTGEILEGYRSTSDRLTYLDQKLRIEGDCAIIVGRTFAPQLFSIVDVTQWTPLATPPAAAAFRSLVAGPGTFYLLSDYSLEVWSSLPRPVTRRRPARLP